MLLGVNAKPRQEGGLGPLGGSPFLEGETPWNRNVLLMLITRWRFSKLVFCQTRRSIIVFSNSEKYVYNLSALRLIQRETSHTEDTADVELAKRCNRDSVCNMNEWHSVKILWCGRSTCNKV